MLALPKPQFDIDGLKKYKRNHGKNNMSPHKASISPRPLVKNAYLSNMTNMSHQPTYLKKHLTNDFPSPPGRINLHKNMNSLNLDRPSMPINTPTVQDPWKDIAASVHTPNYNATRPLIDPNSVGLVKRQSHLYPNPNLMPY